MILILKARFKINKSLKNLNYQDLLKISKDKKQPIPLLNDLIKLSKNKRFLMLEIKPLFTHENIKTLLKEVKIFKKIILLLLLKRKILLIYIK